MHSHNILRVLILLSVCSCIPIFFLCPHACADTNPNEEKTELNPLSDYIPVYPNNFPDPFIMRDGDTYYGYSTNADGMLIPVITSNDIINWKQAGDALSGLPEWAADVHFMVWAPCVLKRGDKYVLYYTLHDAKTKRQCISLAVSDSPTGPFIDSSTGPFIHQIDLGGSIDPSPFIDDNGKTYLLWKNDGNCCGFSIGLWIQELSGDGLELIGKPTELIRMDQRWEEPLIEGPALIKNEGKYYLFYSANWWESGRYAVGYAVCESLTGPCYKPLKKPTFKSKGAMLGPGGQEFFTDTSGNTWMAFHAWTAPNTSYREGGKRSLHIKKIAFVDGKPIINQ